MAQTITTDDLEKNKGPSGGEQVTPAGQGPQASAPGAGPSSGSPQGAAAPAGSGQAQSTVSNPNTQKGSGYTNIQRIVSANQGNRLGQTVGGGVQQAGQQVQSGVQQAGQQFQQQSQANQFDTDQNKQLVQNVFANPAQYGGTDQTDPNSQQGQQFQHLISGQYSGPQGLQGAQQLQAQAGDVSQLGQALGSTAGRIGVLQRFVGSPQYSGGQQNLDSLLLGQTGGQDIAAARRAALGIQSKVGSQVNAAQQQAQQLTNQAQGFGTDLQGQFGQNVTGFEKGLQDKATQAQTTRDAQIKAAQDQLSSGQVSQELADQLGIGGDQQTFNIDPNKFLNASNLKASEQNIAGTQDYARLAALKQLGGQYANSAATDVFGKFTGQDAQAGQFDATKAYDPDKAAYQKAVSDASTDYHSRLDPIAQEKQISHDVYNLTQQRDQAAIQAAGLQNQMPGGPQVPTYPNGQPTPWGQWKQQVDAANAQAQQYQQQITAMAPGAGTNTRSDWATSWDQDAYRRLAATQAQLDQQYGTKKFSVLPKSQS